MASGRCGGNRGGRSTEDSRTREEAAEEFWGGGHPRQPAKYLVNKDYFDELMRERESIAATLEILADQELAARLMSLGKTIDRDVEKHAEKKRLLTMEEVFDR